MARIIDSHPSRMRRIPLFSALAAALLLLVAHAPGEPPAPIHALLVGGGPDLENNTAQIEEHLRFVTSLVPASTGRIVLFADGKTTSRDLSYSDATRLTPGQRALDILLPNDGLGARVVTRTPVLGAAIDGPSRIASIERAFARLASLSRASAPPSSSTLPGTARSRRTGTRTRSTTSGAMRTWTPPRSRAISIPCRPACPSRS